MIDDALLAQIPPLLGCLYCHSEGTTSLTPGRKFLGFGSNFPVLKCSHCGSTALLDVSPIAPEQWRIRYRRINQSSRYYYVASHLGKVGWLSAHMALSISTDGFVQRKRVQQAKVGDLSWLQTEIPSPPPPFISHRETIYLTLKAVTYQQTPPHGFVARAEQRAILDSGKLFVTNENLHLLGQRRDWSHPLYQVHNVTYDAQSWTIALNGGEQPQEYRGINLNDQFDAQLVSAIIEALWQHATPGEFE
jgi:hypothetical protein